jgi:predicted lipid carrier protein YhbT
VVVTITDEYVTIEDQPDVLGCPIEQLPAHMQSLALSQALVWAMSRLGETAQAHQQAETVH